MKAKYDLANIKSRPNPYAKRLKQQVTLPLGIDVIKFDEILARVPANLPIAGDELE